MLEGRPKATNWVHMAFAPILTLCFSSVNTRQMFYSSPHLTLSVTIDLTFQAEMTWSCWWIWQWILWQIQQTNIVDTLCGRWCQAPANWAAYGPRHCLHLEQSSQCRRYEIYETFTFHLIHPLGKICYLVMSQYKMWRRMGHFHLKYANVTNANGRWADCIELYLRYYKWDHKSWVAFLQGFLSIKI